MRKHSKSFTAVMLPGLKGFFMRMLSADGALADDFLQELFLRVYEARGSYQHGKSVLYMGVCDGV